MFEDIKWVIHKCCEFGSCSC